MPKKKVVKKKAKIKGEVPMVKAENPIKKWLKDNDVGPSELADKIQVRYQTVHAWVTESNTNMGASNIEKVHQVTGISRDELVKWAARKQLEAEGWKAFEAA